MDKEHQELYYDMSELLTKNALINFILSERGPGKTFAFKNYAIKDFIRTGWQFMYVRRYTTELKTIKNFFVDIADKFPDHKFAVVGGKKGGTFRIDDKVAGYFFPLTGGLDIKSTPFSHVNKLAFDEFIIPKGSKHYMPNEVFNFFDFVETVNRMRISNKLHDLLRLFLMGNTISVINPYFSELNLYVDTSKRFNIYKEYNHDIVVEIIKNNAYKEAKASTRMGQLMMKMPYGQYGIQGEFYQDDNTFIAKRPKGTQSLVSLRYALKTVYFYFDFKNGKVYASYDEQKATPWRYSLTADDHQPNYFLIKSANACAHARVLVSYFAQGCMYFESLDVKETTIKILHLLGVKGR